MLMTFPVPDRFGRVYNYEEGADLMHEENNDGPGYKRWPDKVREALDIPLVFPLTYL